MSRTILALGFGGAAALSVLLFCLVIVLWLASYVCTDTFQIIFPSSSYSTYYMQDRGLLAVGRRADLTSELDWQLKASGGGFSSMAWNVFADQSDDLDGWSFAGFGYAKPEDPIGSRPPFMFWWPHWCLALLTGVTPLIWIRRYMERRMRPAQQFCRRCGYDLRATPERCPECGTVVARKRKPDTNQAIRTGRLFAVVMLTHFAGAVLFFRSYSDNWWGGHSPGPSSGPFGFWYELPFGIFRSSSAICPPWAAIACALLNAAIWGFVASAATRFVRRNAQRGSSLIFTEDETN